MIRYLLCFQFMLRFVYVFASLWFCSCSFDPRSSADARPLNARAGACRLVTGCPFLVCSQAWPRRVSNRMFPRVAPVSRERTSPAAVRHSSLTPGFRCYSSVVCSCFCSFLALLRGFPVRLSFLAIQIRLLPTALCLCCCLSHSNA